MRRGEARPSAVNDNATMDNGKGVAEEFTFSRQRSRTHRLLRFDTPELKGITLAVTVKVVLSISFSFWRIIWNLLVFPAHLADTKSGACDRGSL